MGIFIGYRFLYEGKYFRLDQASLSGFRPWSWTCKLSHLQGVMWWFLSDLCNDIQCSQDLVPKIYVGFSFYSSVHPSTSVGSAFRCYYFLEELSLWSENLNSYNIPNHSSQNEHKRLVMLPFLVQYSGCYPGEIQSLYHQDWDRMHSCDNHIMSCEIRIFNETPLSAIQIRVCHPPEQAETFPDWLRHLYGAVSPLILMGAFNP